MMLRGGIWQMVFGLGLGVGLAMLMASGLELILFQVETLDVGIYVGVIVALVTTGLLANLIPAGRASRIDPIIALRPQ